MQNFRNLDEILKILTKKITLLDFVFPKLRTPKRWLDKCLKKPVSEDTSTTNMVTGHNVVEIFITAISSHLLMAVKAIEMEKISLIDIPNLGTAC